MKTNDKVLIDRQQYESDYFGEHFSQAQVDSLVLFYSIYRKRLHIEEETRGLSFSLDFFHFGNSNRSNATFHFQTEDNSVSIDIKGRYNIYDDNFYAMSCVSKIVLPGGKRKIQEGNLESISKSNETLKYEHEIDLLSIPYVVDEYFRKNVFNKNKIVHQFKI